MSKNLKLTNFIEKNILLKKYNKDLTFNFKKIFQEICNNLEKNKNTFHSLSKSLKFNFNLKELKKFKKFNSYVIIGMGGSILGSEAIYNFLSHKIKKKIYFFDNLDEFEIEQAKKLINKKKTLFLIISKSGNTIETITNLIYLKIIKKKSKNIIIISEKKDSFLFRLSKKYKLFFIEHKPYIGGRYSVLSEVGIVPAFLMGLNINKLKFNFKSFFKSKNKKFLQDSTIKLANLLKQKKYTNIIFLNYSPKLEKFLYWCQQLIAESLGKNLSGFLPVISNAPKDHHSLLQLYLDGPKDKLFHIFSYEKKSNKKLTTDKLPKNLSFLNNKSIEQIKNSQKNALIKTLLTNKIPFREFKIKKFDEETLGQLFSYFILETAITGKLININPFDQPAVEQVKILTKKQLI